MNNKTTMIVIILLIFVAGVLFWSMKSGIISNNSQNTNEGTESTEDTSAGSINAGSSSTLSYADALSRYKSVRLELNEECKASPSRLTIVNNSALMIDNLSPTDRVVTVGSPMNIRANSFKIIKIMSDAPGAIWNVGCNESENVATIVIQ